MKRLARWWRFNLVGALGVIVQLSALALLNPLLRQHYLCAAAFAVELTLLHNFVWHLRYTWRDRPEASRVFGRLIRFHLSNGAVSMLGNLVLMRALIQHAHLSLLVANAIAILCCSVLNFLLSDGWSFAADIPAVQDAATVSIAIRKP
jgi:putative flippase GtrA